MVSTAHRDWVHVLSHAAGIRYVVDAGRAKQKLLEGQAGLARFEVRWVSKASAEQRAGRAGRTGPGHCYRSVLSAQLESMTSSRHYFAKHTCSGVVVNLMYDCLRPMIAINSG